MNSKTNLFIDDGSKSSLSKISKRSTGLIFDIQKFAIHDGYGIRTLVFMKGCPLRCKWCSNPESQEKNIDITFNSEKCLQCYECINICPTGILSEKNLFSNSKDCVKCGNCVDVCYSQARQKVGRYMEINELFDIVKKDITYYNQSNGGVTIGGGEPTLQNEFLTEFLKKCKLNGISTAIETCGYTPWEKMKTILDYTDLLLFDIKHINSEMHEKYTGVKNEIIIKNAILAAQSVKEMIIRVPLIPEVNNSSEDLNSLGKFIFEKLPRVKKVNILPYHSIGESKSMKLGEKYSLHGLRTLTIEEIYEARKTLQSYKLEVDILN